MDVFNAYTYGTAGWLSIQGLPLIVSPSIVTTLIAPKIREASSLEVYFARSLGFALLCTGVLTILLSGSVPLSSRFSDEDNLAPSTNSQDSKAPYALPSVIITMIFHVCGAFYSYAMWTENGAFTFMVPIISNMLLASMALWIVLFGSSNGRISKKTGMDKRTSAFPFKNKEAHSEKKKGL